MKHSKLIATGMSALLMTAMAGAALADDHDNDMRSRERMSHDEMMHHDGDHGISHDEQMRRDMALRNQGLSHDEIMRREMANHRDDHQGRTHDDILRQKMGWDHRGDQNLSHDEMMRRNMNRNGSIAERRDDRNEKEIQNGIRNGQLTNSEAKDLKDKQNDIDKLQKAAQHDGHVSSQEAYNIQMKQNQLNHAILKQRTDDEHR